MVIAERYQLPGRLMDVRLVIRGDSMVSGFASGADVPADCAAPWTQLGDEPVLGVGGAIAKQVPALVMALPGLKTPQVEKWFNITEAWHSTPTIFWFGRADVPVDGEAILLALQRMTKAMQAGWWVLPVMPSRLRFESGDTARIDRVNAMLRAYAGARFVDPIRAIYGASCLPRSALVDLIHPNEHAARSIAGWLIAQTGVSDEQEHKRAA